MLGRVGQESGRVFLDEMDISEAIPRIPAGQDCRLRHQLACRARREIHDRETRPPPVEVDYGSEFRYRDPIIPPNTLTVVISQSGETADTLAAQREAKQKGSKTLAICNVVGSMITREAAGTLLTHAGPEIGVASTKAFTSQFTALFVLACTWGRSGAPSTEGRRATLVQELAPHARQARADPRERCRHL